MLTDKGFSSRLLRLCRELSMVRNETVHLGFWKRECPDEHLSFFHLQGEYRLSETWNWTLEYVISLPQFFSFLWPKGTELAISVVAELYVCLKSDLKIVNITTAPKSKDLMPMRWLCIYRMNNYLMWLLALQLDNHISHKRCCYKEDISACHAFPTHMCHLTEEISKQLIKHLSQGHKVCHK